MNLLVLVPTRGRPYNACRLEHARQATCSTAGQDSEAGRVDFLYVVDDDDPVVEEYVHADLPSLAIIHRQRLGATLNFMASQHVHRYDAVGFMGDDHLPRTLGWDKRILEALDHDGPRIVYGNDLLQGPNLPTAVFMSSRIIRAAGHMVPPGMVHLYLDNYWKALGERLGGLIYLDDVVIEHLHPAAGKADMDDGYREANASSVDHADREFWAAYQVNGSLETDARRVEREYRL